MSRAWRILKSIAVIFPLFVLLLSLNGCGSSGGSSSGGAGQQAVTLVRIEVTPANPSIPKGTTLQFQAKAVFSDQSTQDYTKSVTWTSAKPNNVFIIDTIRDQKGLATAVSQGSVAVTASFGNISGSVNLTVSDSLLVSIALDPSNSLIGNTGIITGTTAQFTATGTYTDNSTKNLTALAIWSASPSTFAMVNSSGLVTGLNAGLTTVSATMGSVSGNFSLNIVAATLQSITITPSNSTIHKGNSLQFKAMGNFNNGMPAQDISDQVTWASSDTSIAAIDLTQPQQIWVKGAGVGQATITATLGAVSDQTTVMVDAAVLASISITAPYSSIAKGTSENFTLQGTFSDGTTSNLTSSATLSSSNPSIATINNTGVATALYPGTTTISAAYGGFTDFKTLTVTGATLDSIEVTPANFSLPKGITQQFTATGNYTDGSQQDLTSQVTWSSTSVIKPTVVATISNAVNHKGLAITLFDGDTTITAIDPSTNKSGTTMLTVTADILSLITVTPANPSVVNKATQQFTATGTFSGPNNILPLDVTTMVNWSSSNSSIAVISNASGSNGLATAQTVTATSSTTIKATLGSVSGTTLLNVDPVNQADLQINSLSGSLASTSIYISDTEINNGNMAATTPFYVSFYLSPDPISTFAATTSTYVGSRVLSSLPAGGINSATKTFIIPSDMTTRGYYLCGITDSTDAVIEYNEANNSRCFAGASGPFLIGPDLQVNSLSGSLSGTTIIISDTEINSGNLPAGPITGFTVSFYFSGTTHPDPVNDILIGTRTLASGLGAGKTSSATTNFPVPPLAPPGNYYLCAITDSGSTVAETRETNNSKCTTGTYPVGPDLRVSGVSASLSGSTLYISDTEINSGNQAAGAFTVSYFLSTDTVYDAGDPSLGTRSIADLAGGSATNSATKTFSLPNGISNGDYYIIAVTDSLNKVGEVNEGNNTNYTSSKISVIKP